jgi:hypothetical protein
MHTQQGCMVSTEAAAALRATELQLLQQCSCTVACLVSGGGTGVGCRPAACCSCAELVGERCMVIASDCMLGS